MATKTKTKKAAAPPVEEEELELEELDEDVEEEAPAKKGPKVPEVTFGAGDLAKLASKATGKEYNAKTIRTLLRKMARDGRLTREISPENRSRYDWTGPDDPEVKRILKAIKGGEIEKARDEALNRLKEQSAKKREAAKAGKGEKTKGKGKKAKQPEPEVEELDDDDEELEDDDDE